MTALIAACNKTLALVLNKLILFTAALMIALNVVVKYDLGLQLRPMNA